MPRFYIFGGFVALQVAVLYGCGAGPRNAADSRAGRGVASTSFSQWCEEWHLTCPTGTPANVPIADHPWSVTQWHDFFGAINGVTTSPSDFAVTRAELDDANLKAVVADFHAEPLFDQIRQRLDASNFQTVTLADGALTATAAQPATFATPAGLQIQNAAQMTLRITSDQGLAVSGLTLGSVATGASEDVHVAGVTAQNIMQWQGEHVGVDAVPIKFLAQEVAGLDLSGQDFATFDYADLAPALAPLKTWLTTGQRDIDLEHASFTQIAAALPSIIADQGLAQAFAHAFQHVTSMKSTAASRGAHLVAGVATQEIRCNLGDKATLMIEPQFGVQSLTALGSDGATIHLYGVKAKTAGGILTPTMTLDQIDLTPTKIVIYNIPIVGTYTIDMTKDLPTMAITCD